MEMNGLDQLPRIGDFLDQMGLQATLVQMPATAVAAKRNGCCKSSGANPPRRSDWRAVFGPAGESDSASRSNQTNKEFLQGLGNQSLERFIVGVLEKDRLPRIATIQGVINGACFVSTWWSGHERGLRLDH
jgi:hypothetical protein